MFKIIVESGVNINHQDYYQDTALHIAARKENLLLMKELINNNADTFILNKDNKTAFDLISDESVKNDIIAYNKNFYNS